MLRALVAAQLLASAVALHVPRDLIRKDSSASHSIDLTATQYGIRFEAPITIGGQTLNVLVDTGSSDLFVVEDNFQCAGEDLEPTAQSICQYADAAYSVDKSNSFDAISDLAFQATYDAGTGRGFMGREDVSLGDVTVPHQPFGVVNWSTPMGLGSSGVMGLAYAPLTSAYEPAGPVDDRNLTVEGKIQPYTPFLMTMANDDLIEPFFSLALKRIPSDQETGDGGVMVLGGRPDLELSSDWAVASAEPFKAIDIAATNSSQPRAYWATTVEALNYGDDGEYTTSYQTIVDSGAPTSNIPLEVVEAYSKLVSPPATWSDSLRGYAVDCDAEMPAFSVKLGGITFDINPEDMVLHTNSYGVLCQMSISRPIDNPGSADEANPVQMNILGANFLKNVVAEFDWGKSEMRFAARKDSAASSLEILGRGRFVVLIAMVVLFQGF